MSNYSTKGFQLSLQPAIAWIAILGLFLFSTLCILAGVGRILNLAFPVGAFAVSVLLYFRYPLLYIGFTWWIWFLTPLIRRLVDYRSGFTDPSPVLLTPLLVTLVSFITLVRNLPKSNRQGSLPFIMGSGGVFYGFLVGLIENSKTSATVEFLQWLTPILFGFHLFLNWRDYPTIRQNIQRTFLWGVVVMGAYGIWQYLVAPDWDRFWLRNVDIVSFGQPVPLGIRVWSTMNSPQGFAGVMGAGLLLLFSNQGILRFLAAGVGYLSFLLSLARSAWLGWFSGLLILIPSLKTRLQMRIITSIIIAGLLIVPLVNIGPFSKVISRRFQSLSHLEQDTSLQERSKGYSQLLDSALSETLGRGMGSVVKSQYLGQNDSGILSMFFSLGWFGTIPYMGGILLLLFKLFQGAEARFDVFASTARAVAVGTLAQIGLNVIQTGSLGLVLWGFLGIGMAAHKYYLYQRTVERETG